MPARSHAHPVDRHAVDRARRDALTADDATRLGELLTLLSDPTRLRMLFVLVGNEELCVGDLALALDISMDQSSYALKQLRGAGLVQQRRDGRIIYYRLTDGFPRQLLDHCLRQLLTLTGTDHH